jgi:hypothetical protein
MPLIGTAINHAAIGRQEQMSRRRIIQILFGIFVFIAILFSQKSVAYAANNQVITNWNVYTYMERYNPGTGRWENLNIPHYFNMTTYQEVFCIEALKDSPLGDTYNLDENTYSSYPETTRKALSVILKSGHPKKSLGLGTNYNRYATALAVKFWMGDADSSQTYAAYNLSGFADRHLRDLAKTGTIPGKIRMKAGYPSVILEKAIDLYLLGRNTAFNRAGGLDASVRTTAPFTVTNDAGARTDIKGTLHYSATVSTQMASYALEQIEMPAGVTVTAGATGVNGTVLRFQVDPVVAENSVIADIPLDFLVADPRLETSNASMHVTNNPLRNPNVQRMAWVSGENIGTERYSKLTLPLPYDLKVDSVTVGSTAYTYGQKISVTVRVRNNSKRTAPAYTVRLTGDNSYGSQDSSNPYGLAPGAVYDHTFTFATRVHSSDTTVNFSAVIDPNWGIREATRVNNIGSRGTIVRRALPDLVASVATDKNTYAPGETIAAKLTVTNSGYTTASGFNTSWGTHDSTASNPSLGTGVLTSVTRAPGQSYEHIRNIYARATRDGYSLRFGYFVDSGYHVAELNESNNIAYKNINVGMASDLEITNVTIANTVDIPGRTGIFPKIIPGGTGTITVTVRNNGRVPVPASSVLKAISVSHGSITPAGGRTVPQLSADGGTGQYTFTWTSPANLALDTSVRVNFKADADEVIAEYNESNNTKDIRFTPVWPDLVAGIELVDGKEVYEAGETIKVRGVLTNTGNLIATNFKSELTASLPDTSNIVPGYENAFKNGDFSTVYTHPSLSAYGGRVTTTIFSFIAPTSLTAKDIKLTFEVDSTKVVTESNENNNIASLVAHVFQLRPNLYFAEHNIEDYYAGKDVLITARVMNGSEQPVPEAEVILTIAGTTYTERIAVQGKGDFSIYSGGFNYEGNIVTFRVKLPDVSVAVNFTPNKLSE